MGLLDRLRGSRPPAKSGPADEREDEPREQMARVFIARSEARAIVVTMHHNRDGPQFEDASPVVLEEPLTPEAIGRAVLAAMAATSLLHRNMRDYKPSDWPAFRASGLRTIKKFEADFIYIEVDADNNANIIAVVTGFPQKDAELRVTGSVSMGQPVPMGALVLQVYEACRERRV